MVTLTFSNLPAAFAGTTSVRRATPPLNDVACVITVPATEGTQIILPLVNVAPVSLRVTLKETVKRFPASGCAGTLIGWPITGFATSGDRPVPLAVCAPAVIATPINTNRPTDASIRLLGLIAPLPFLARWGLQRVRRAIAPRTAATTPNAPVANPTSIARLRPNVQSRMLYGNGVDLSGALPTKVVAAHRDASLKAPGQTRGGRARVSPAARRRHPIRRAREQGWRSRWFRSESRRLRRMQRAASRPRLPTRSLRRNAPSRRHKSAVRRFPRKVVAPRRLDRRSVQVDQQVEPDERRVWADLGLAEHPVLAT